MDGRGNEVAEVPVSDRLAYYSAKRVFMYAEVPRSPMYRQTWAQWFEDKYGESLDSFTKRAKVEDLHKRIREQEMRDWGFTRADALPPAAFCSLCGMPRRGRGGWSRDYDVYGFPQMLCGDCMGARERAIEVEQMRATAMRARIARAKRELQAKATKESAVRVPDVQAAQGERSEEPGPDAGEAQESEGDGGA